MKIYSDAAEEIQTYFELIPSRSTKKNQSLPHEKVLDELIMKEDIEERQQIAKMVTLQTYYIQIKNCCHEV